MNEDLSLRVSELERRVDQLEGRSQLAPQPAMIAPPPILSASEARRCAKCGRLLADPSRTLCVWCQQEEAAATRSAQRVTFTNPPMADERPDAEFILGARVLPRVGAVLVLLGIAFFAGWAYKQGLITPWMAFLGEIGASIAFIALGFGLRKTQEQFGEVLKAIGAMGLFTSFAAGHLYHQVFNAEAMIGGCLLVSAANMAYASASGSKSFWSLGVLGGFITSFMPLTERQVLTSEALLAMTMTGAFASAAYRKWLKAFPAAWVPFILLQIPLSLSHEVWWARIGYLEGVSFLGILLYGWSFREQNEFDSRADVIKVFGVCSGVLGFMAQNGSLGSLHTAIFGTAIGLYALMNSSRKNLQNSLLFTSAALLLILTPFGLSGWHTSALMLGLAGLLLIAEFVLRRVEFAWLAVFEVAAASVVSLFRFEQFSHEIHIALNGAMLASLVPLTIAFRRHYDDESPVFAFSALGGFFFTSMIGGLLDHNTPPFGMPLTISWTVYGLALLLLGLLTSVRDLRVGGIIVFLLTLIKVVFNDLSSVELIAKVAVLTGLGIAMLVAGYLVIRVRGRETHSR